MLAQVTKLRNKEFKEGNKIARNAYNSVITAFQTAKGRGIELTNKKMLDILKKQIQMYTEMVDREYEVNLLSELLPEEKIQISEDKIRELFGTYEGDKNPGLFMKWLNEQGYEDTYNKGLVAKIVLGR